MELGGPGRPSQHGKGGRGWSSYIPLPGSANPPLRPPDMGQVLAQQKTAGQANEDDGVTWWFRFLTRCVGAIGGLLAVILGLVDLLSVFHPICIAAGFLQMTFGFLTVCMEAPCLCMWFDFIEKLNSFSESRKHYQKALVYGGFGLFPLILCFGMTTFFGSALILVTSVFYGMMAFGKKADQATMMAAAGGPPSGGAGTPTDAWDAGLVANEKNAQQQEHLANFP